MQNSRQNLIIKDLPCKLDKDMYFCHISLRLNINYSYKLWIYLIKGKEALSEITQ